MARKKTEVKSEFAAGSSARPAKAARSAVTWVNPYLNEDDKAWLEGHLPDFDSVILEFLYSLEDDYTVTVTYDRQAEKWSARCYCNSADHANTGYAVSIRAGTSSDAWYALAYCCEVKLGWDFTSGGTGSTGRWG